MTPRVAALMPGPTIYYVRHGLTAWNAEQRLQGRLDVPLIAAGREQAAKCGEILSGLLTRDGHAPETLNYVSSPLSRARETMEIMRATLGLQSSGFLLDARLAEIAFGEWEGLTYSEVTARDKDVIARRDSHKWEFLPPGGESYAQVGVRMRSWYQTVDRDTVVAAHGGTARALIALFAIVPPDDATHYTVEQGVVYVFSGGTLARHG
jgi:broad specificity phosphatase PhoE